MHAEALCWVQGINGSGNPGGVHSPYIRMDSSNNPTCRMHALQQTQTTVSKSIDEPFGGGPLRTLPYFWKGDETSLNPYWIGGINMTGPGTCRVIFSGARLVKNAPFYSSVASGGWWV